MRHFSLKVAHRSSSPDCQKSLRKSLSSLFKKAGSSGEGWAGGLGLPQYNRFSIHRGISLGYYWIQTSKFFSLTLLLILVLDSSRHFLVTHLSPTYSAYAICFHPCLPPWHNHDAPGQPDLGNASLLWVYLPGLGWGSLCWVPAWQSHLIHIIRMHETAPFPILFDKI